MPNREDRSRSHQAGSALRSEDRAAHAARERQGRDPPDRRGEEAKEYKNYYPLKEDVAEFDYQPTACKSTYRMVALKKTITVEPGQKLLYPTVRYFFYITNRRDLSAAEVVASANDRCNQENLNAQLKGDVRALRAPVDTLVSKLGPTWS